MTDRGGEGGESVGRNRKGRRRLQARSRETNINQVDPPKGGKFRKRAERSRLRTEADRIGISGRSGVARLPVTSSGWGPCTDRTGVRETSPPKESPRLAKQVKKRAKERRSHINQRRSLRISGLGFWREAVDFRQP